ncbi:MAG: hypothetical protein IPM70_16485 [Proteobacteria bacterium]|nr:hypothetical protein [Pseudomonadota bacterium]
MSSRTLPMMLPLAAWLLAGCSPAAVSVQQASMADPPPPPQVNRAPLISGLPATNALAGAGYRFAPTASDADGDTLTFSILNKPAWASFSTSTGELSGTPRATDVGTTADIAIRVTDGTATVSLPTFSLSVLLSGNGTALLSWTPPTQNSDGSTLTDLGGYWIFHSTDAGSLVRFQRLTDPAARSYTATGLAPGRHFFAVAAYATSGAESALSSIGQKDIP